MLKRKEWARESSLSQLAQMACCLGLFQMPWMCFDLREFKFCIIRIHAFNLFSSRSSQNLDDLNKLINSTFTRKQRLSKQQFNQNTTNRPDITSCSIFSCSKNKLRCSVISWTYIRYIWFAWSISIHFKTDNMSPPFQHQDALPEQGLQKEQHGKHCFCCYNSFLVQRKMRWWSEIITVVTEKTRVFLLLLHEIR